MDLYIIILYNIHIYYIYIILYIYRVRGTGLGITFLLTSIHRYHLRVGWWFAANLAYCPQGHAQSGVGCHYSTVTNMEAIWLDYPPPPHQHAGTIAPTTRSGRGRASQLCCVAVAYRWWHWWATCGIAPRHHPPFHSTNRPHRHDLWLLRWSCQSRALRPQGSLHHFTKELLYHWTQQPHDRVFPRCRQDVYFG